MKLSKIFVTREMLSPLETQIALREQELKEIQQAVNLDISERQTFYDNIENLFNTNERKQTEQSEGKKNSWTYLYLDVDKNCGGN